MGRRSIAGIPKRERSIVSVVARRFSSRAVLERDNLAASSAARSSPPAAQFTGFSPWDLFPPLVKPPERLKNSKVFWR